MLRTIVVYGLGLLFCGVASSAKADDPNCVVTLFKTAIQDNIDYQSHVFLLDQIDESHYDSVKNDLKIIVPEYFSGSWSQFKEKRDLLRTNHQLTTDQRYSRQYAISTLNQEGVAAYTSCLRAHRDQTQLSLYISKTEFNDQAVTFVVDLKSPAELAGPARIEVYGASRLLSVLPNDDKITMSEGVIHIELAHFRDIRTITVERQSPKTPVRVTAEDSGLVADPPIEVGPVLKAVTKSVDIPIPPVEDTIHYLARRLQAGTNNIDWRWSYEKLPGSGDVPQGQSYVANMCICANGQRQTGNFHTHGRCATGGNTEGKLIPESVKLISEPDVSKPYGCGSPAQTQVPAVVSERGEDGNSYCFSLAQSLNVPSSGSSECAVHFKLVGMIRKQTVVFELP